MKVLHIPYTYDPDPMGGTEYYVQSLARETEALGHTAIITAPATKSNHYKVEGIDVYRFKTSKVVDSAYGAEDHGALTAFESILRQTMPDIVHMHANSSAVSGLLLNAARRTGARTVFTYHTPTVSCFRGTMMAFGQEICNGRLLAQRCTACVLDLHEVSPALAYFGSRVPAQVGRILRHVGLRNGAWLGLGMRALIEDGHKRFSKLMEVADHIVAVCDWVRDVLQKNGIQDQKLSVVRQGLIQSLGVPQKVYSKRPSGRGIQLAYFGRLDATKGVDILIKAILSKPDLPVALTIFGVTQEGSEAFRQYLIKLAAGDRRIRFVDPVKGRDVVQKMADYDAICVPSTWLETGPLVVYEAFGARVPVLGSRLGGIQELVTHNSDGLLIEPGNVSAWAEALSQLSDHPELLLQLVRNIKSPRTMFHVAQEMVDIYQCLRPDSRLHS